MRAEVMKYFGLVKPFKQAGFRESEANKELMQDIRNEILRGSLVALCGMVGSGKTITLRQLRRALKEEKGKDKEKIIISRSLAVEKQAIKLNTLITAMYYDLTPPDKPIHIPKQAEQRERGLMELIAKHKCVALFIDEAHDLNGNTLRGLKRLMEIASEGDCTLSVVLAGHLKLKIDLCRPAMEEIGSRTSIFDLDSIESSQEDYLHWLIADCSNNSYTIEDLLTEEAIQLVLERSKTPLQVQKHMITALEIGYATGDKQVNAKLLESILSRSSEDLELILARNGYGRRDLVEQFGAKPRELSALFDNTLDTARSEEIRSRMKLVGLPV